MALPIIAIRRAFHALGDVGAAIEGRLPRGLGVTRLTDPPMELSAQWLALGLAASTVNGSQQTSFLRSISYAAPPIEGGFLGPIALGTVLGGRMNRQIDSSGFEIGRHALTWAIAGVVATLAAVAIGVGGWVGVTILREQIAAGGIAISTNGAKRSPALAKIRTGRTRQWRSANYSTFNVASRAFWEALVAIEGEILADPASTVYWQRRREVEQILRQQEAEEGRSRERVESG